MRQIYRNGKAFRHGKFPRALDAAAFLFIFIHFFFFSYSDAVGRSDLLCSPPPPLLFPLPLVLIPEVVIYSLLLAEGEKKIPYFLLELEIKIKTDRLCWKRQITFRNFWWLIQSHVYDPSTLMWVKVFAWRMGNAENAVDKRKKKKEWNFRINIVHLCILEYIFLKSGLYL